VLVATVTVPGMLWPGTAQSYEYEPAVANVYRNVSCCSREPELNTPVLEVTVCVLESWFVQQTVDPGVIVTDWGENANPLIETSASPCTQPPCARASEPKPITIAAAIPQAPVRAASAFMPAITALPPRRFPQAGTSDSAPNLDP
jgi:hypothetical protein